jgi:7-carboxy-7-deazaguanine synthase
VSARIASEAVGAAADTALAIAEAFGPTFQGEGPSIGRRCSFVRLSGCNQGYCWCDTPYTWDWGGVTGHAYRRSEESHSLDAGAIFDWVTSQGTDTVVIAGGEPLLQQRKLLPLLQRCEAHGLRIEVETAGTLSRLRKLAAVVSPELAAAVTQFNVSPKLANFANPLARRHRPAAIEALQATGKGGVEIRGRRPEDLVEIDGIVRRHGLHPVCVMPEGVSREQLADRSTRLRDHVRGRGRNLTTILHILVYGNQRGV